MIGMTVRIPRRAAPVLLLLAGCTSAPPASLLLTITSAPGAPAPEAVQVRTFDGSGALQPFTSFVAPPPRPDGQLGTVVIYPAHGGDPALRIQAQGMRQGVVISEGTTRATVASGRQETATLALAAARAADSDGDGVPDAIDNCPAQANERQDDTNRDGRGDACAGGDTNGGSSDGGGSPGAPTIAAVPDAAVAAADSASTRERPPEAKPPGAACASGTECRSSFCTDGVCCEAGDCGGACRACNLPGASGTCRNIPADSDPRAGGCIPEPASSCGRTGKCDGEGACQRHPAGTTCAPGQCDDRTEVAASTCSADGRCAAGKSRSCGGGFACKGDACATSCTTERECTEETYCVAGACKPRHALGSSCKEGRECAGDFCADGHCCMVPRCADGAWCGGPGGICVNKIFTGDPAPCSAGYQCNSGVCQNGMCR